MARWQERFEALPPVRMVRRFSAAGPGVLASAIAFNLFFALVPAALAVLAAASVFGRDEEASARTLAALRTVAPDEVARFVADALAAVSRQMADRESAVIAVAALVAVWSASRGVLTIQRVLRRIEGLEEHRPWWMLRLTGIALTVGAGLAMLTSSVLIVAGEWVVEWAVGISGQDWFVGIWEVLRIPVGSLGLLVFLLALYRWGPPRPLPGAPLAAVLAGSGMVLASLGFRAYLARAGSLGETIAVAGAVAVLLIWLYVLAYVIIMAAAFSSQIVRRRRRESDHLELGLETLEHEAVHGPSPRV